MMRGLVDFSSMADLAYSFTIVLGAHGYVQALSSCREWGLLSYHRARASRGCGFSGCTAGL